MKNALKASGTAAPKSSSSHGQKAEVGTVGLRMHLRIDKEAPTDIDVTSGPGGILVILNPQGVARISRLFPGEAVGVVMPRLLEAVIEHAVHGRKDEKYCKYVSPWLRDRKEKK